MGQSGPAVTSSGLITWTFGATIPATGKAAVDGSADTAAKLMAPPTQASNTRNACVVDNI
jgi:hypothetical protein